MPADGKQKYPLYIRTGSARDDGTYRYKEIGTNWYLDRDGDVVWHELVTRTEWVDEELDQDIADGVAIPYGRRTSGDYVERHEMRKQWAPASNAFRTPKEAEGSPVPPPPPVTCSPTQEECDIPPFLVPTADARLEWVRNEYEQLVLRCYIGSVGIDVATIDWYDAGFVPCACHMERPPPWHDVLFDAEVCAAEEVSDWVETHMKVQAPPLPETLYG